MATTRIVPMHLNKGKTIRQSFRPGEITPEEANRIGYEFAERFLKGNHAFIVYTHTDKHHIHNPRKRRSPLAPQKAQLVSSLEAKQNQGRGRGYDLTIQNQITKQKQKFRRKAESFCLEPLYGQRHCLQKSAIFPFS